MRRYYEEKNRFRVDAQMKIGLEEIPFEEVPPPPVATVFLQQHVGPAGRPLVKEKDHVKTGQKLSDGDEPLTVPVHSPVTGTVINFADLLHPVSGEKERAIVIEVDGDEEWEYMEIYQEPEKQSKDKIVERIREAGIVGLGGAAFPTHIKLSGQQVVDHLIINAKESDPNLACDVRLMLEKPEEITQGIEIIGRVLGVQKIMFATRTSEGELPRLEKVLHEKNITLAHIRPSYSVGSERLLVRELLGREVPPDKFPPDVGVVVHNVATCVAVAQAVIKGKPLIDRGLSFYSRETGGRNLWVRMGTPVEHILQYAGLKPENFDRVVLGSIMMGRGVPDIRVPLVKSIAGVVALTPQDEAPFENPYPCIRCGYCDLVCPVDIYPSLLLEASERGNTKFIKKLNVEACIDCSLCSYVCPSAIRVNPKQRIASN